MDKMLKARVALLLDHPWLATALLRLPLVKVTGFSMITTLATDGFVIYYCPEFCSGLTGEEVEFCLAHELLHCLLDHIPRKCDRDPPLWNVAIDYATNLLLKDMKMHLPAGVLDDERFRGLTAEQIYDTFLKRDSKRNKGPRLAIVPDRGRFADFHCAASAGFLSSIRPKDAPDQHEMETMRREWHGAFKNKMQEFIPGNFQVEIEKACQNEVPWQMLLAHCFGDLRKNDYRWSPPSKRHIWRGLWLPSLGVPAPAHVIVAIDTSGSLEDEHLSTVLAELDSLRRRSECHITIIECDAVVQCVEHLDPFTPIALDRRKFRGRGGTSFKPVFNWIQQLHCDYTLPKPEALFYFTDGFGDFPASVPDQLPVFWLCLPGGLDEFPFGRVIRLGKRGD